MTFIRKYESGSDSSDEDITYEELAATYKLLYTKWEEPFISGEKLNKTISSLLQEKYKLVATIIRLKEGVILLNSNIENMTKSICMLNNDSDMLDGILEVGKMSGNMKAIWFDFNSMIKKIKNSL